MTAVRECGLISFQRVVQLSAGPGNSGCMSTTKIPARIQAAMKKGPTPAPAEHVREDEGASHAGEPKHEEVDEQKQDRSGTFAPARSTFAPVGSKCRSHERSQSKSPPAKRSESGGSPGSPGARVHSARLDPTEKQISVAIELRRRFRLGAPQRLPPNLVGATRTTETASRSTGSDVTVCWGIFAIWALTLERLTTTTWLSR